MSTKLTSILRQLNIESLAELCAYSAESLARSFDVDQLKTLNNALKDYLWQAKILPTKMSNLNHQSLPIEVLGLAPLFQHLLKDDGISTVTEFIQRDTTDHLSAQWPMRDRLAVRIRIFCLLTLSRKQIEELRQSVSFKPLAQAANTSEIAQLQERSQYVNDQPLKASSNQSLFTPQTSQSPKKMNELQKESRIKADLPETEQSTEIEVLGLSHKVYECLERDGIETIEHLAVLSDEDLLKISGIGITSLAEIREKLAAYLANHQLVAQPQLIEALGLSRRAYNCLRRAGIETIERVAAMSDDDLLAIRYLGSDSLTEIREKLAAYLAIHPLSPLPQPSEIFLPKLEQSELQKLSPPELSDFTANLSSTESLVTTLKTQSSSSGKQKFSWVNDNTPVAALDLPLRIHNTLIKAGVKNIGQLVAMSYEEITKIRNLGEISAKKVEAKLLAYLTQKPLPLENNPTEISKSESPPARNTDASDLSTIVRIWLAKLTERQLQVISLRYGLENDETLTLEQVGQQLGVTRERIRQIEAKALRKLQKQLKLHEMKLLSAFISKLFEKAGGVINKTRLIKMLNEEAEVEFAELLSLSSGQLLINIASKGRKVREVNLARIMELVFQVCDDVTWLKQTQAWVMNNELVTVSEVISLQTYLFELVEQNLVPVPLNSLLNSFKQSEYYKSRGEKLSDEFILACLRSHPDLVEDEQGNIGLEKWTRRRLDDIILTLRKIGEPVHYTIIAKETNALLPPDQRVTGQIK